MRKNLLFAAVVLWTLAGICFYGSWNVVGGILCVLGVVAAIFSFLAAAWKAGAEVEREDYDRKRAGLA